ncbi:LAFE_0D06568g1_1 [Lachancea fermentati]|uniref:LAFE_0D06568g1_1 n=1 Tax=Lachancea fermentati TaxID=4955 RepID=A0A1G4MBW3_LACFM|nr:LAFE_0D06568g1_1 [Lachancea fermentati]
MSNIRRSQRIRQKSSTTGEEDDSNYSANLIEADEQTGLTSDEDESSEEDEDIQDEDYEEKTTNSSKRKANSRAGSSQNANKRQRRSVELTSNNRRASKKAQEHYTNALEEFTPTELFEILADSEDISVEELANKWLDTYSESRDKAMQDFINFILNCCGALVQVEEHDVVSNDSSNETVGEVQLLFQKQEIHEFHLLISKTNKKRSKHKPLFHNFSEFMEKLMELANERGFLYDESTQDGTVEAGSMIMDLLTWLSAFSVCKIRCLRYTATLIMYLFEDYLTALTSDLETSYLVKLRKQLSKEQNKKRKNSKAIEKLEKSITEIQDSKTIVEDCIDNIIKLAFVHRFKDVDEDIRTESIVHLAVWLENYPEYFFKVTFLKYFGWLLSDSCSNVRLHVLKALLEIVNFNNRRNKHNTSNSAWRQFFERFKQRILDISLKDIDLQVRLCAVRLLVEINSFGYLERQEILTISSLIFDSHKMKLSSTAKNVKFLNAVAKFFAHVEKDEVSQFLKSSVLVNETRLPSQDVIEAGLFLRFLVTSLATHLQNKKQPVGVAERTHLLFQAAEFLQPYFVRMIQPMCDLLTFDGDLESIRIDNEAEGEKSNLLLPLDENSIIQYIVVLNGLCHGGIEMNRSQNKKDTAEAIIPNLEKLFLRLPTQSDVVTYHLFSVFQMFSFEDWITSNQETAFLNISETIIKSFVNTQFTNNEQDQRRMAYTEIIAYFQRINLPNINEMWKLEEVHIRIPLQKFLELRFDDPHSIDWNETIIGLYDAYINKLVLLGKITRLEFNVEFLELFFSKFLAQLPQGINSLEKEALQAIDFRFLVLLVAWNLQSWCEIFNSRKEPTAVSRTVLDENSFIIKQISTCLTLMKHSDANTPPSSRFYLEWKMCSALADIVTASKIFELKLPDKESEWKVVIRQRYLALLNSEISDVFLDVFLFLESVFAKNNNIDLDRFHSEDVNFNNINDSNIENAEQELHIFAVKIKSLLKLGAVEDKQIAQRIEQRIALNKKVLGQAYESIINETAFQSSEGDLVASHSKADDEHIGKDNELDDDEEIEPIDEDSEIMGNSPHSNKPTAPLSLQRYSSEI